MRSQADKAELIQSIAAYYIPASLFIATLIASGGIFLVYNNYGLGWLFIALAGLIMVSTFVLFCRFQNKLRANGLIGRSDIDRSNNDRQTTSQVFPRNS